MPARIKKGDNVTVLSGKDKGRGGKVLRVYPKDKLLLIEGINLKKRHRRPRKAGEKGSIVQMPAPMPISKVMIQCPNCQKAARVKIKIMDNGEKKRSCKKCEVEF
ncbi:MAG: 50S ribosomal protein L24 [Candidatus Giovannonibacteria bacterium GW2011_GWB1_45_9b]|uniref:Large ribosomal subunit protein uL24 n=7 Tax=Candidatus Giovannoniibacteriota TaxID=1752738 RepID=A0A1F5X164_9BACT|nr:MAG: 50S ribosomal protein L24 [Candidatus Giovannonibacteria bacterium GW2011_GWC2_44_8]KKU05191.1 MAG: 50S ribosomal protein L24 [Candidatus Giovannonibacteria bacterium GW2011_GWA2_45_21]KKU16721.1 MAG: 50S ribosomal protein L24 [Candidatus Giovannonibacteria bacterium GW2011_GWB1_45_9b]OGF73778.1 MAG: 50S ribosomal protein L24 [Candidatus Giovannonibacteria bacterium RIFCSPHIGHO2_02_43_16]OGF81636.1 MAG: 50S ribosomal protein L24 [Candidatus Giovannonibacteria bacterium RIFCSPHIGHO2_12_4